MNTSRSLLGGVFVGFSALVGSMMPSSAQENTTKVVTRTGFAATSPTNTASERIVYEWDPATYRSGVGNPWTNQLITRPDGRIAQRIDITGESYNNFISVPAGKLLSGREYMAVIEYEIATPTSIADTFYMFARSKNLGLSQDYWQKWNGDTGRTSVATLTISLTGKKASDDWAFYVGTKGPGSIIIDSLKIVEGDGFQYVPATLQPIRYQVSDTVKLPTGAKPFVLAPPAPQSGLRLQAKDFGLKADDINGPVPTSVAEANVESMKRAIDACRTQKASVLSIAPGTYRFSSTDAIPLVDLEDLTIDGQGAQFIFEKLHNGVPAISVIRCQRMIVKNLKIDWNWDVAPLGSLAKVISTTTDNTGCDLTFPELNEKQFEDAIKTPWVQMVGMDANTLTRNGIGQPKVSVASLEKIGPRTLRVTFNTPVPLLVGSSYCVRHFYYGFDAFKLADTNNFWFDNIIIYSIPGMGWYNSGDMYNLKLTNCKIVRPVGSRRPFTTTADGFHVSQSQGNLTLENLEITGNGDDPINIHDNCFQGVERVADTRLKLVKFPRHRLPIKVGDKIELFHSNYSPLNFISTVVALEHSGTDTILTLSNVLPANLPTLSILQNRRFDTSNVRIANSYFHDCNGRSIILSARNATIENNTFKNTIGTAIQMHTEIVGTLWAEGGGASNVVIRGNTFDNTSYEGRYENAVIYTGAKLPIGVTEYSLFRDMLIEKNRFIDSSGPAVSLLSAKNIIVRDNRITAPSPRPLANHLSNSLYASYSSDLFSVNNIWESKPKVGKAGVLFNLYTTSNVTAKGNGLLDN